MLQHMAQYDGVGRQIQATLETRFYDAGIVAFIGWIDARDVIALGLQMVKEISLAATYFDQGSAAMKMTVDNCRHRIEVVLKHPGAGLFVLIIPVIFEPVLVESGIEYQPGIHGLDQNDIPGRAGQRLGSSGEYPVLQHRETFCPENLALRHDFGRIAARRLASPQN